MATSNLKTEPRPTSETTRIGGIYAATLVASIAVWFIAIRAPLWQDETWAYWEIKDGFSQIWARQLTSFPAYSYTLWLWTRIAGTSEWALRIPSVIAMLGAVYLLYRVAREVLDHEAALIALVVFCTHPIVSFAAVDIRPYAFAVLLTNATIFILLRLRNSDSNWLAALFGFSAASILYFHYLFAAILPALAICFFIVKTGDRKILRRQFAIATGVFLLAFLPVIPGLKYLFSTSKTHVYEAAPKLSDLVWTLVPGWLPVVFAGTAFIALVAAAVTAQPRDQSQSFEGWRIAVCGCLAFIPLLILYGISMDPSIRVFTQIHRLVAVPGIALCWAFVLSRFRMGWIRLLFCGALAAITVFTALRAPNSGELLYSWKHAIEVAEKNASTDNAPVLVCSDFIESDYMAMPVGSAKESRMFAPLSYYKLTVPVVPLPRDFNSEAIKVGSQFIQEAEQRHQRFLAMGDRPSYRTLDWLTQRASGSYDVHKLGVFDQTEILEFVPRTGLDIQTNNLQEDK
jgi:4-amino-4-deoxy-L-arabinose transferase-like glycosyltransferase